MNIDKLTHKMQEALRGAHDLAGELDHQEISPGHVLLTLLGQEDGILVPLLQKAGASPAALKAGSRP